VAVDFAGATECLGHFGEGSGRKPGMLGGQRLRWIALGMTIGLLCGAAHAQSGAGATTVPAGAQAVLLEMATHAAVIFTGQVETIARADANGYVDVRFRVNQAVRGVSKTGAYVLREWAGLWSGGAVRYRVGQRYLMLLTGRGTSGMSSPVDGMDGAIPLIVAVAGPVADGHGVVAPDVALAAPELQVDVRWLNARAVRAAAGDGESHAPEVAAEARVAEPVAPEPVDGPQPIGPGPTLPGPIVPGPVLPRPVVPVPVLPGGTAWVGPIAPLASGGSAAQAAGPGVSLSSILGLLQSKGGSVHVGN
jgi:hypothetical protein